MLGARSPRKGGIPRGSDQSSRRGFRSGVGSLAGRSSRTRIFSAWSNDSYLPRAATGRGPAATGFPTAKDRSALSALLRAGEIPPQPTQMERCERMRPRDSAPAETEIQPPGVPGTSGLMTLIVGIVVLGRALYRTGRLSAGRVGHPSRFCPRAFCRLDAAVASRAGPVGHHRGPARPRNHRLSRWRHRHAGGGARHGSAPLSGDHQGKGRIPAGGYDRASPGDPEGIQQSRRRGAQAPETAASPAAPAQPAIPSRARCRSKFTSVRQRRSNWRRASPCRF